MSLFSLVSPGVLSTAPLEFCFPDQAAWSVLAGLSLCGHQVASPSGSPTETRNVILQEGRKMVNGRPGQSRIKVTQPSVSRRDFQAKSHSFVFVLQS